MIAYYKDVWSNGQDFLWDLANQRQFMYGQQPSDDRAKLYMIDLDMHAAAAGDTEMMWKVMAQLKHFIEETSRIRATYFDNALEGVTRLKEAVLKIPELEP